MVRLLCALLNGAYALGDVLKRGVEPLHALANVLNANAIARRQFDFVFP